MARNVTVQRADIKLEQLSRCACRGRTHTPHNCFSCRLSISLLLICGCCGFVGCCKSGCFCPCCGLLLALGCVFILLLLQLLDLLPVGCLLLQLQDLSVLSRHTTQHHHVSSNVCTAATATAGVRLWKCQCLARRMRLNAGRT